ncbi:MAG: trypsin-like peptidase domain-containing protein [Planctomycetes bacterium]|nr:trypsin-like peptidase domain-containing protein [Planctomycetota bacterium]
MLTFFLMFLVAQMPEEASSTLERVEREVAAVAEKIRPSVVGVTAGFTAEFESRHQITESLKLTGIVHSADGVILCDGNVLERATEITVRLPDDREAVARLLGVDRRTSVAVLRVAAKGLAPAEFARPDEVRQGIYAIVVGNTLGLRSSVEVGFVSGLGRSIQVGGRKYEDMIQMTTAVNAGDCGGFVANSRGQLIGMVHSSYQGEIHDIGSLGILRLFGKDYSDFIPRPAGTMSFATPASTMRFVAERILKHGRMVRGWMGVTVRPLGDAAREQFGIRSGEGCEVWSVDPQGPAARVLRRRDILLSIDGRPVTDVRALRRWVTEMEEPRALQIRYLRGGQRREAEVRIVVGD